MRQALPTSTTTHKMTTPMIYEPAGQEGGYPQGRPTRETAATPLARRLRKPRFTLRTV